MLQCCAHVRHVSDVYKRLKCEHMCHSSHTGTLATVLCSFVFVFDYFLM